MLKIYGLFIIEIELKAGLNPPIRTNAGALDGATVGVSATKRYAMTAYVLQWLLMCVNCKRITEPKHKLIYTEKYTEMFPHVQTNKAII